MARRWLPLVSSVCTLVLLGCGGESASHAGGSEGSAATGGSGAGGSAGGSGGAAATGGDYGMFVNAYNIPAEYEDVVATLRDGASGKELEIVGRTVDEDGTEGFTTVVIAPYAEPGSYDCRNDGAYLTSFQTWGVYTYDSRNWGGHACYIRLTELGDAAAGGDAAGTFEGVTYDENGGRLALTDGRFRIPMEL